MFSGIVENLGTVKNIHAFGTSKIFEIESDITKELKIDQSVAHDGVCLTVTKINLFTNSYEVTAIQETLLKTTLSIWAKGYNVNLERSIQYGDRIDGHLVQGHVDGVGTCVEKSDMDGSWYYGFIHATDFLTVPKGSICVNGISLTVVDSKPGYFSVAIIPYTYAHTNIQWVEIGSVVNLEFDILGKYFWAYMRQADYLKQN